MAVVRLKPNPLYISPYEPDDSRFRIYFEPRTPRNGPCPEFPEECITRYKLIQRYAEALQFAFNYFRDKGWKEPTFGDDPKQRIDVKVQNREGAGLRLDTKNRNSLPKMLLRSDLMETHPLPKPYVNDPARAEATHEVAHLFTDVYQQGRGLQNPRIERGWHWFNEATAAYFERKLNPYNFATLNYGHTCNWVYRPHWSPETNDPANPNSSKIEYSYCPWLLQSLVEQTGDEDLIRKVWHDATDGQLPRDTLTVLLKKKGLTLEDALHRYAVESFRTRRLDRMAFIRYRNRKLDYVAEVEAGTSVPAWSRELGPLACRYYKIRPTREVVRLRIAVHPDDHSADRWLKATLHGARHRYLNSPDTTPLVPVGGALVYDGSIVHFRGGCLILVVSSAAACSPKPDGYYNSIVQHHKVEVTAV